MTFYEGPRKRNWGEALCAPRIYKVFTESHLYKLCKNSSPESPPDPSGSDDPYDDSRPQRGPLTTPLGPKLVRSEGDF